jgi:outer membrane immunogenic protein
MKRIDIALFAGIAAVVGFGHNASAADLSWTGFYIGVHGGAAWQSTPGWNFTDPNGIFLGVNLGGSSALGAVAGLQVGYNWQFTSVWVVGAEGDFSWTSLSDHRTAALFLPPASPLGGSSVAMSSNPEWLSSLRAKIGYNGLWNTLFYATGGGAIRQTEYAAQAVVTPATVSNTSFTNVKGGWVAGAGAEWMATPNILLRVEYLYYGFTNNQSASAPWFQNLAALAIPANYSWGRENIQVFRIAGSYKF